MSVVKLSVVKTGQLSSGPVLSYLIEHPSGKNLVYGLGLKSDLSSYPPATQAEIKAAAAIGPNVDLAWRLEEAERERPTIAATVLPSTHWTHIGAPLHFLPSSEVVIGQGVLATLPGYPVNESATFLHLDLPEKARTVREVSGAAVAGSRTGVDYFGDGSVLVLNGETPGTLDTLVRTVAGPVLLVGAEGRKADDAEVLSTADVALEKRLDADGPWEVALVA